MMSFIRCSSVSHRSSPGRIRPLNVTGREKGRARAPMGGASTRSSAAIRKTLTRTTGAPPPASPVPVTMRATRTPRPSSSSSCRASIRRSSSVNRAPQLPPQHLFLPPPQPPLCLRRWRLLPPPPLYLLSPRPARCLSSRPGRRFTLRGYLLLIRL